MIKFRTHIQEIHYTIQLSVLSQTMPLPTCQSELGLTVRDKRALRQYVVKLPIFFFGRSFVTAHNQKFTFESAM